MKQLRGTDLKRFLRDHRRAHPAALDLVLVLQSVAYPVNVGSLFRIADASGVNKLFLCSATATPPHPAIGRAGRSKDRSVEWEYFERAETAIEGLKAQGFHICAVEITDQAKPYDEFDYPVKLALVLGNEEHGVSPGVLDLCDSAVFVPMYGKGASLNVHVSAAVVVFQILSMYSWDGED